MPRYFFDLEDGGELTSDEEGLELRNLHAAQAEAAKSLADMARDAVHYSSPKSAHHMAINVRDESGPVMQIKVLFEIEKLTR